MKTGEEKKRLYSISVKTGIILAAGLLYALFVSLTGIGIPCVFHLITGLYCPGCGISRMFLSLLRFDIVSAARYNLLVLCLLPFAIVLFFYKVRQYVKQGYTEMCMVEKFFYCTAFVLCIVFCVLRNTPGISFFALP